MKYGYDNKTKLLFSWDSDFHFEGHSENPPDGAFIVSDEHREWCEMAGCYFLSGNARPVAIFRDDGEKSDYVKGFTLVGDDVKTTDRRPWENVVRHQPTDNICLCGDIASDPHRLASFCIEHPCSTVYVCPIQEGLAALGVLVMALGNLERPRRVSFCEPCHDEYDDTYQEFDPKLEGDGFGRMAKLVSDGQPVLNRMMTVSCGISPFYGKVLSRWPEDDSTCIIRLSNVEAFFPKAHVSLSRYAAQSVPVEVDNTSEFESASGWLKDKVRLVVTSDYIPNMSTFMRFYLMGQGKPFVFSTDKDKFSRRRLPVFTYNRGYRGTGETEC